MVVHPLPLDQASSGIVRWFAGRLPGAGWGSFAPLNFSGLSSAGRVTPNQIAAILEYGAQGAYGDGSLVNLMPARSVEVSERVKVRKKGTKNTVTKSKKIGTSYARSEEHTSELQ